MKICILSASPNKEGLTNSCVEICKNVLEENNVKADWKVLNKYDIKRCEACGKRGWGICYEDKKKTIEESTIKLINRI